MKNDKESPNKATELLFSRRVQLALTVVSLLLVLSGIYLTAQLSPLVKDIALNETAIAEVRDDLLLHLDAVKGEHQNLATKSDVEALNKRLDDIYSRLGTIESYLINE